MILITFYRCTLLPSRLYISLELGLWFIHLCDVRLSGSGMWRASISVCLINEYIDDSGEEIAQ